MTRTFAAASGLDPATSWPDGMWRRDGRHAGAGVYAAGDVCDVVGTAEPVCAASSEPRYDPTMLVECHPHADPDGWLLENPGFVSGGNLRWWRDQFAQIERDAEAVGLGDAYDFLSIEAGRRGPRRGGSRVPSLHAGRHGARVERGRQGCLLRPDVGPHARSHDTRDPEGSAFALRDIWTRCAARGSRCGDSPSWVAGRRGRCGVRSKPMSLGCPCGSRSPWRPLRRAPPSSRPWERVSTRPAPRPREVFVSFRPDIHEPDDDVPATVYDGGLRQVPPRVPRTPARIQLDGVSPALTG